MGEKGFYFHLEYAKLNLKFEKFYSLANTQL